MINRRFMIVPPALPRRGHAELLGRPSEEFSRLRLETANMRVLQHIDFDRFAPTDACVERGVTYTYNEAAATTVKAEVKAF